VYVTFKAPTEYVGRCFLEYGVPTDASGTYAALYRPVHLIGLELGVSVASVVLRREPTGVAQQFVGDVVACAKRDLTPGELLDGEGGGTVYGKLVPASLSLAQQSLPIGLASRSKVVRPVRKDQLLTYADVALQVDETVLQLRKHLEKTAVGRD
jgi:predicted homoserine dehydrogenase-like protein